MRFLFSCLFLVSFLNVFSQEEVKPEIKPVIKIDSLYREDQFYFSVTYNLLVQGPDGLKQDKFSAGLSGGFCVIFLSIKKEHLLSRRVSE